MELKFLSQCLDCTDLEFWGVRLILCAIAPLNLCLREWPTHKRPTHERPTMCTTMCAELSTSQLSQLTLACSSDYSIIHLLWGELFFQSFFNYSKYCLCVVLRLCKRSVTRPKLNQWIKAFTMFVSEWWWVALTISDENNNLEQSALQSSVVQKKLSSKINRLPALPYYPRRFRFVSKSTGQKIRYLQNYGGN